MFLLNKEDGDFVVSSNARLIYPQRVEYPINLEKPLFIFPGIIGSEICRAAIDLCGGSIYNKINKIDAATKGLVCGRIIRTRETENSDEKQKIIAINKNFYNEAGIHFNCVSEVEKNIFILYELNDKNEMGNTIFAYKQEGDATEYSSYLDDF